MCWTLCSRKNLNQSKLMISTDDAFKIWCIFNFLSDDQYPLVIITEEVSVGSGVGSLITPQKHQRDPAGSATCVVMVVVTMRKREAQVSHVAAAMA